MWYREQYDRRIEGSRLIPPGYERNFPVLPRVLDRLIEAYRLTQTTLVVDPCCRMKICSENCPVSKGVLLVRGCCTLPYTLPKRECPRGNIQTEVYSKTAISEHPTGISQTGIYPNGNTQTGIPKRKHPNWNTQTGISRASGGGY